MKKLALSVISPFLWLDKLMEKIIALLIIGQRQR